MPNINNLPPNKCWKLQTAESLDQTTVLQNTYYTAFDRGLDVDGKPVKIIYFSYIQNNDETDAKNIQIKATIDGIELIGTVSLTHNTYGGFYVKHDTDGLYLFEGTYKGVIANNFPTIFGHVKIEIETTSAPGTNQRIRARTTFEFSEAY